MLEKVSILNTNSVVKFLLLWFLLFGLSFLIRIPYFLSNAYWFDGDEAIVGVMANDFLGSGRLPFLLYGQNYGFASVEVVSASLFISILGNGVMSLKLAGLFIHSFGLSFLVKSLRFAQISKRSLIIVMVLVICFPPFYLWATQMRTLSFALACVLFYISFVKQPTLKWLILSVIISIFCLLSQPMMYLFTAPFIGVWLLKSRRRYLTFITYISLVALTGFLVFFVFNSGRDIHQVATNLGFIQIKQFITQIQGFLSGFTGFHYFTMDVVIPLWWKVMALISLLLLGFVSLMGVRNEDKILFVFFVFAIALFLISLSFFKHYSPRYWINLYGGVLLLYLYTISKNTLNLKLPYRKLTMFLSLSFLMGILVSNKFKIHFYDTQDSERNCFWKLQETVIQSGVKGLYTTDVYLQWQWNYLLGDKIPCTSFNNEERTNKFLNLVESTYMNSPSQVGLIGFYGFTEGLERDSVFSKRILNLGEKYYFVRELRLEDVEFGRKRANE